MLNLDSLRADVRSGRRFKYVFFWGHRPRPDGTIGPSCLSQWFAAPFSVDGIRYPTAEHHMMAAKARLFDDTSSLAGILAAAHPGAAKKLGRGVTGFDEETWQQHRVRFVIEANRAKFSQHEPLRDYLLRTKNRVLVEASPVDRTWGIGLAGDDERAQKPLLWKGENLLGFALMEVRNWLRVGSKP